MPTYIYKNIETGEIYELKQSMKDDAYTTHPETGVAIKRMVVRPAIAFKGSGFYANDSRSTSTDSASSEKRAAGTADKTQTTTGGADGATKSASDAGSGAKKSDSGGATGSAGAASSAKTGSAE